jgi:predicted transposase YdaD
MKTDTIFYQLFNTFHTLLFELIEHPIAEVEGRLLLGVLIRNISIPEPISSSTGMASDRYLCKAQL